MTQTKRAGQAGNLDRLEASDPDDAATSVAALRMLELDLPTGRATAYPPGRRYRIGPVRRGRQARRPVRTVA